MIVKQIRFSEQAKDRLSRLKGKTGIEHYNALCRWALCYSLKEGTLPTDIDIVQDSNLEIAWHTFTGEFDEIYEALMIAWCKQVGLPTDQDTLSKYFKLHIERGISYLSGTNVIKSLNDLLNLTMEE